MNVLIVIPAFNEEKIIYSVIRSLPKTISGVKEIHIIVINDGSTDNTAAEAVKAGVKVISHLDNRGLGAAIKTGKEWARRNNFDIMITFDGDGQHNPQDVQKLVDPIVRKKAELVIGSRFMQRQQVPLDRLIINKLANLITFGLFGVSSTDSQSGLRAFSKKAIKKIDFKADRMEFSSEILLEAKRHKLKIKEVPIKAIYTSYSRRKGQKNTNAFPVFARSLVRLLR